MKIVSFLFAVTATVLFGTSSVTAQNATDVVGIIGGLSNTSSDIQSKVSQFSNLVNVVTNSPVRQPYSPVKLLQRHDNDEIHIYSLCLTSFRRLPTQSVSPLRQYRM